MKKKLFTKYWQQFLHFYSIKIAFYFFYITYIPIVAFRTVIFFCVLQRFTDSQTVVQFCCQTPDDYHFTLSSFGAKPDCTRRPPAQKLCERPKSPKFCGCPPEDPRPQGKGGP